MTDRILPYKILDGHDCVLVNKRFLKLWLREKMSTCGYKSSLTLYLHIIKITSLIKIIKRLTKTSFNYQVFLCDL
jgi:hypothetical protein